MIWSAFIHIYQPPWQKKEVLLKIAQQSYWRIIHILQNNPKTKITLNINGALTEQLAQNGLRKLLNAIRELVKSGQIELTGTAKYHPILPLISKREVIRQIELNNATNKKYFGKYFKPRGFFPPEMCWKGSLAPIIRSLGFEWVILDEIAVNPELKENGYSQSVCFDGQSNLHFFFRSRIISDLFSTMAIKSAEHFIRLARKEIKKSEMLITAFDGENLGHHSPLMDNRFEQIIQHPHIKTMTHSELFDVCLYHKPIVPRDSSWSTRPEDLKKNIPYPLWLYPGNDIQKLQWQILSFTLKQTEKRKGEAGYKKARTILDQALSSDQFWWASALPWWGTEEAYTGTELFLKALKFFPGKDGRIIQNRLERKLLKLKQMLDEWQISGKADKIKKAFLNHETITRYFGGERVG